MDECLAIRLPAAAVEVVDLLEGHEVEIYVASPVACHAQPWQAYQPDAAGYRIEMSGTPAARSQETKTAATRRATAAPPSWWSSAAFWSATPTDPQKELDRISVPSRCMGSYFVTLMPRYSIRKLRGASVTVYFQHVGEGGGKRDFPRTIGTRVKGLRHFHFAEIEGYLSHLTQSERDQLATDCNHRAQDGFQIWGLPTGAQNVLRRLEDGDILLLLESATFGGAFHYGGRVIAHPSDQCFDLSKWLWGEQKFALIVFLKGHLTSYSWYAFCDAVGYKNNWNPAGKTYRVPPERLSASPFNSEPGLVKAVIGEDI